MFSLSITLSTAPRVDEHGTWKIKTILEIETIETSIDLFKIDYNRVPNETEGLDILLDKKYLLNAPKDFWGNEYSYHTDGKHFQIYSVGPDGIDSGGLGDDVVSWDKKYDCKLYNDCLTVRNYIFRIFAIITLILTLISIIALLYKIGSFVLNNIKDNKFIH